MKETDLSGRLIGVLGNDELAGAEAVILAGAAVGEATVAGVVVIGASGAGAATRATASAGASVVGAAVAGAASI